MRSGWLSMSDRTSSKSQTSSTRCMVETIEKATLEDMVKTAYEHLNTLLASLRVANLSGNLGSPSGRASWFRLFELAQQEDTERTARETKLVQLRKRCCPRMRGQQRLSMESPDFTPPWESPDGERGGIVSAPTRGD